MSNEIENEAHKREQENEGGKYGKSVRGERYAETAKEILSNSYLLGDNQERKGHP